MNAPALHPGITAWRIGRSRPLRCIVVRVDRDNRIATRASTFARDTHVIPAGDVFTDREACRAEIQRRRAAEGSTS